MTWISEVGLVMTYTIIREDKPTVKELYEKSQYSSAHTRRMLTQLMLGGFVYSDGKRLHPVENVIFMLPCPFCGHGTFKKGKTETGQVSLECQGCGVICYHKDGVLPNIFWNRRPKR